MAAHPGEVPGLIVPSPPLADGDLMLRPPVAGDVPWIVRGCADPEVPRWTTIPERYTDVHARMFIEDAAVDWAQGTHARFAILLGGDGAGMVGLHHTAGGRPPEIGYWVGYWARRRGVATRATRLVAAWAFDVLGVELLELRTMPGNTGSEAVAAAAGFTRGHLEPAGCEQRGGRVDVYRWTRHRAARSFD